MRFTAFLTVVLMLAGCDCQHQHKDGVSYITSATTPAGYGALTVLNDNTATQERKSQAMQLLFELERGRRLDETVVRLDELAAKMEVLLERRVEAETTDHR